MVESTAAARVGSLRNQVSRRSDTAAALSEVVGKRISRDSGVQAWRAFLLAHATLMRRLESDLRAKTGSGLNDFDVLGQLGEAGGSLRMAELAERVYSSRSGMTRRVDRLEADGLLRRVAAGGDARGVLVVLTDKGAKRLQHLADPHLEAVNELFVSRLSDTDLAALARILRRVSVGASFG